MELSSLKYSAGQATTAYYLFVGVVALFSAAALFVVFLYIKMGSFQAIQQGFPNIPFQQVLYVVAALVVFMILLMLFNSQYDVYFQKRPSTSLVAATPPKTFWSTGSAQNPQDPVGLKVLSTEFPMSRPDTYTMGVQLYVGDSRSSDKMGPYRHILHRGTDELVSFTPNSPGSVPRGRGDLNDGLPNQMNPGLFLDQYTNDLLIYIDTDPQTGTQANRESIRIPDLPLKKAFYVHVVVHDSILEVYINCRLAETKILSGTPRAVPNDWHGRIGFARAAVVPHNLKLWDSDLHALQLRNMCPAIPGDTLLAPSAGCATNCGSSSSSSGSSSSGNNTTITSMMAKAINMTGTTVPPK